SSTSSVPFSTLSPDLKWIALTMPETCGLRSAPFSALVLPTASRRFCHGCVAAVTVDTVCGGFRRPAIAFWIILTLKDSKPKIAAKAAPTRTSMMAMRRYIRQSQVLDKSWNGHPITLGPAFGHRSRAELFREKLA